MSATTEHPAPPTQKPEGTPTRPLRTRAEIDAAIAECVRDLMALHAHVPAQVHYAVVLVSPDGRREVTRATYANPEDAMHAARESAAVTRVAGTYEVRRVTSRLITTFEARGR